MADMAAQTVAAEPSAQTVAAEPSAMAMASAQSMTSAAAGSAEENARVVVVSNVAPTATKANVSEFFAFCGPIVEVVLHPAPDGDAVGPRRIRERRGSRDGTAPQRGADRRPADPRVAARRRTSGGRPAAAASAAATTTTSGK